MVDSAAPLVMKHCEPCEGHGKPLSLNESRGFLKAVPQWRLAADGRRIHREWSAADFSEALGFFQRVAHIAEQENHHPDLHLTDFRKVVIELSTHAVQGLTENDFILAAKIDTLPIALQE